MKEPRRIRFSIVVPIFNEEGSTATLYVTLTQVMRALGEPYEIVFIDDGSTDRSPAILGDIQEADSCVRVVTLRRNFGQTPALKAGFDAARGEVIIAMDGDLQHDPAEIPSFIEKLDEGFDIVSGWRSERKDTWITRRLPSRIANWAMAKLSGVPLHDFGTTFKAYRASVHSRSGSVVRRPHHGDPCDQSTSSTREIKVRTFQDISRVSGSPEHKVLAGLLDQAHALLWLFRAHCDRGRHNDRVPAAFPEGDCSYSPHFQRHSDLCDDRSAFGWSSNHVCGTYIRDVVTHLL